MKNNKAIGFIISLFLMLFFVSCEEDIKMIDIFEVSATDITLNYEGFLESGGSAEFEIGTTDSWRITSQPDWVTLTRTSGDKGRQTIFVTVEAIGPDEDRVGQIVIESLGQTHTITVKQTKKIEQLVVSPTELLINIRGALVQGGGEPTVYISTNSDWTVNGLPAWITVDKGSGEQGDASVVLVIGINDTGQLREGIFTIKAGALNETITVKQDVSFEPITGITKITFDQKGNITEGESTFEVDSPVPWSVSGESWIHVSPTSGEAGKTMVTVSADPSSRARTGEITFTDSDGLVTVVAVKQEVLLPDDGKAVGHIYLSDDFEWVRPYGGQDEMELTSANYTGKGAGGSTKPIRTTAGALDDFTNRNYEVYNYSGDAFYFGAHYFKMGKTNVMTGLIIKSIPEIPEESSSNITLTFHASPNRGGSGAFDDVILHVEIEGPGSVGVDDGVTKASSGIDIQIEDDPTIDWYWLERSVVLYGVSSETKITIKPGPDTLGGSYNRWLLNDIELKKHSVVK